VYRRGACFHYLHHPANIEERPLQDHQSASAIRFPRKCFRKKQWVITKMWERGTPNTLVQNTHLRELPGGSTAASDASAHYYEKVPRSTQFRVLD